MAKNNSNLSKAKKAKNDEFYTQLSDIENELRYYKPHFEGKIVLCNCNDAIHGNFAKYFSLNFEFLKLKELICTSYGDGEENGKICIYKGDKNGNGVPDIDEWEQYELNGKGDFRSEEMIELLKRADIVVTNPPFSLFREYVAQLIQYDKKFLIIGNLNAVTYKEIFPLLKNNYIWMGTTYFNGGATHFIAPKEIFDPNKMYNEKNAFFDENGNFMWRVNGVRWFTNLDHKKRHEPIDLYKHYNEEEYPKYDNYDAINVNKVSDIPMDYDGVMGVPISFLDKYCPEQFEIIWTTDRGGDGKIDYLKNKNFDKSWDSPYINGNKIYKRILIKIRA